MADFDFKAVIEKVIDSYMSDIHTAMPGIIRSYDPKTKTATVQPTVQQTMDDGSYLTLPMIYNVPVIFPGSATATVQFPLNANDECLLIFSEMSLEQWVNAAGNQLVTDGGDPRQYSLTDGFCIPGCFSPSNPSLLGTGKGLEIIYKGAQIQIDDNGIVNVNGTADYFTLFTELNTQMQQLLTSINGELTKIAASMLTGATPAGGGKVTFATPYIGTPPLQLDLSSAKSTKAKIGG